MQFYLSTKKKIELVDVTNHVQSFVEKSGVKTGACVVHAPHATAAIIINEFEPNLQSDFERIFETILPKINYAHDRIDDNATAHLISGLFGSGRVIPIEEGRLVLGTWQRVIFCELDGPRSKRVVNVTILKSD
ncbi:MAG: secondary thiamine-phosphate synthase enzyme YjbQ [Candidatus Micrarchaeia archaeon]